MRLFLVAFCFEFTVTREAPELDDETTPKWAKTLADAENELKRKGNGPQDWPYESCWSNQYPPCCGNPPC